MATLTVRTLQVTIDKAWDEAYAFLSDPESFPRWASGMCSAIERRGDRWIATTQTGPAEVRFTPHNPYGVLDHTVLPAGGGAVEVPMRLIPNGDGASLIFTLFRQPDMSDAKFAEDAKLVQGDLAKVRDVLEGVGDGAA